MNIACLEKSVNFIGKIKKFLVITPIRKLGTTQVVFGGYHLQYSPNAKLNKGILDRFMCLPLPECKVQAEYIWIDGTGEHLRSKTKTLDFVPSTHKDCPNWEFDGAATYQRECKITEMYLCPIALYNDPIRRGHNKLVLCEVYNADHNPSKTNHRSSCMMTMNKVCEHEPMFGFEQEYQFMDVGRRPYGWPVMMGEPSPPGPYFCGIGADRSCCREIVEAHYRASLYAGVQIFGANSEVPLGQWEFQIGTGPGVKVADDLWMARYLIQRISEEYGLFVSFHPKLFPNWYGAGCHINFSTKGMRAENGLKAIEDAICKLGKNHAEDIIKYDPKGGEYNKLRLTGIHETSPYDKFTYAVAGRRVSVRIPKSVADAKKGYFEDRRPAANADPYAVIDTLCKTVLLCK